MQSIKDLLNQKEKEVDYLHRVMSKYPDVTVTFSPTGMIFTDSFMNRSATHLEEVVKDCKYSFYYLDGDIKIYSQPYMVEVKSPGGYELEWLSDVISINPQLLMALCFKINSQYIQETGYYMKRFPQLQLWKDRYNQELAKLAPPPIVNIEPASPKKSKIVKKK